MAGPAGEAEALFARLDKQLASEFGSDAELREYFKEGREFGALHQVVIMLREIQNSYRGSRSGELNFVDTPEYQNLVQLREQVNGIIEEVVTFQHGGLNNSVDTMTEVVKSYNSGRKDIQVLRTSLDETKSVLTAKKSGQIPLKDLWSKKAEIQETARILKDLEFVKDAPLKVERFIQQRRYLSAVMTINKATMIMFNEDLEKVTGISQICEQILELKGSVLENIVTELKERVLGIPEELLKQNDRIDQEEFEDGDQSDSRSESNRSGWNGSQSQESVLNAETRSVASGSGGFSSSQPKSIFDITTFPSLDQLNLLDLNESSEANLLDPSASGPLFLQLLVRSVGELRCEDDVEKLLLETDGNKFRAAINAQREHFSLRLKRRLDHLATHSADYQVVENPEDVLQMKLFGEYVGQILEMSMMALKKLLYILRLLSLCRKLRFGDASPSSYSMKDSIRADVKRWWEIIEDLLVSELKIHLVEKSVQDIMDISRADLQQSKRVDDDDDDVNINGTNSISNTKPIFSPTVRLAAPIYRKISNFNDSIRRLFYDEGVYAAQVSSFGADGGGAGGLGRAGGGGGIQRQSSSVGATRTNQPSSLMRSASGNTPNHFPAPQATMGNNSANSASSSYSSKVVELVQVVLENELLPVVQSAVNAEIQNIQTKPELFVVLDDVVDQLDLMGDGNSVPILSSAALSCAKVASPLFHYWLQLPQHRDMVITILDRLVRGFASSAKDEVEGITYKYICGETKFKKLVLGVFKDDILYANYKMKVCGGKLSIDEYIGSKGFYDQTQSILSTSSTNPSSNSSTVLAALTSGSRARSSSSATNGGSSSNANTVETALTRGGQEIDGWGEFWDVANAKYAISKEKLVHDMSILAELAAISHGCDWLVSQLLRLCTTTTKKLPATQMASFMGSPITSSGKYGSPMKPRLSKYNNKQEMIEMQSPMWTTIQGCTKQLSQLSDSCLAIIRAEVEIVCFSHLHILSTLRSLQFSAQRLKREHQQQSNSNSSGGSGADDDSHEAEAIVNDLIMHLRMIVQHIKPALSADALAVVLSPICFLIPRILLKCTQFIADPSVGNNALFIGASGRVDSTVAALDRNTVLRALVTCQQGLVALLEYCRFTPAAHRRLLDVLTEEFERLRRYITLLDMPPAELQSYIEKNSNEYFEGDYATLWRNMCRRNPTAPEAQQSFTAIWTEFMTKKGRV